MVAVHEFQSAQGNLPKSSGAGNNKDQADDGSGTYGTRDSQERIGYHDYRAGRSPKKG